MFAPTISAGAAQQDLETIGTSVHAMAESFIARLPVLAIGTATFMLSVGIAHAIRWSIKRTTRSRRRANVGVVLGRISYFVIVLLGALIAATIVAPSMTPARLISLLGVGGVAIGFAFKDVFQNLLAGILILWREPFRVGDEITSGSFTGAVESIETRATLIRTYDGKRIIIPNTQIYTEPVSVTSAYDMLRSEYDVGIGYGDDVERAKKIILDILRHTEDILQDPPADALVWDLADSSVKIRLFWWTRPDRATVVRLRGRVLEQVVEQLPRAGIDLAYPTQVMLFHDQTEETDGDRTRQRAGWPPGERPPAPARLSAALLAISEGARATSPGAGSTPARTGNGNRT